MTSIEEIERAIERLSPAEFSKLRDWIAERDAHRWDEQIARDCSAGRLDALADAALQEHREGRSTPL